MFSNSEEFEVLFVKPWKDSKSLVITIPKHVCDKLRITEGSRLQILLYKSLIVLKHAENIDYERELIPKLFALIDKVFEDFRELRVIQRKKIFGEARDEDLKREAEINRDLRELCSKILPLQKVGRQEGLQFIGEFHTVEEVIDAMRNLYEKYYKD
jgi:bifunctional DNA-binding transcriptional regulator/antitoxin component of YhaV-PrlF toxin-antitoxin module